MKKQVAFIIAVAAYVCVSVSVFAAHVTVSIPIGPIQIESTGDQDQRILMDGYGCTFPLGAPTLPSRILPIALPPGAQFQSLRIEKGDPVVIEGSWRIAPRKPPRLLSDRAEGILHVHQQEFDENYQRYYESGKTFPDALVEYVRSAAFRRYNLVDLSVTPFEYCPSQGILMMYPELTVEVIYTLESEQIRGTGCTENDLGTADCPEVEAIARSFISNYDESQRWYPGEPINRGEHEFVVITTSALVNAVQPLIDIEIAKGRTTYIATTEWINSQYSGRDLAEKMRTFLREKYPASQWGITDVCLVGHHTDVPMREVAQDLGYGNPLTDFYFAELSAPDNAAWDSNNNGQWWDSSDSADFYNEVNVGRIPWSNYNTVLSICQKSAAFELNDDPGFKSSILFLGGFFWEDTDNAVLMEAIAAQPHMSDWYQYRMYEQNSTVYSSYPCDDELTHTNVMNEWPSGSYCFVDWAGHGSPTSAHIMGYGSAAFIESDDCSSLNDSFPAIIFADACSNSDTDYTNIGAAMLQQGAVGFVGATKVALGCPGWSQPNDGSSQSLDYFFATHVTSADYSQGESHQISMRNNYINGGWDDTKYEMAEWNLWGNPDLGLTLAIGSDGVLSIDHAQYGPTMLIGATVRDLDVNLNPAAIDSAVVTLTTSSGIDSETLILPETAINSSVFSASMNLSLDSIQPGNGILELVHGEAITVTYVDADDGHGGVNVPKTVHASADCIAPVIGNVAVTGAAFDQLVIEWDTDEPSTSTVFFGIGMPTQQVTDINSFLHHEVILSGLDPCTEYVFYVVSTDSAQNTAIDDNAGTNYVGETWELVTIFGQDMASNPGWTTQGEWAWGVPTGGGGQYGNPDPTSGHTGNSVYGYNLNGDYPNNLSEQFLTTGVINCSDAEGSTLGFWRWLGVERSAYDHAALRISTNGSNWTEVWENPDVEIADDSWIYQEFDISAIADGQATVYLRWVMGSTDSGWRYCGWNIDDVTVFSSQPCSPGNTPTPPPTWTPAPTNTPVPTSTPFPTYTPGPSPTPAPTNTPFPTYTQGPTNTPAPTNTPFPTFTPSPTFTHGSPTWTTTPTMTPTSTPTSTPPTSSPTATTPTMTPTATATQASTPDPSVTPTATPDRIMMTLRLNQTIYRSGDSFLLQSECFNPGYDTIVDRYIILDVYGSYFFWPSWGQVASCDSCTLEQNTALITDILSFQWPSGITQSANGLRFWGGLLWPGTSIMAADVAMVTFGYE
ncbi:hypothetical protein JXA80_00690 [bacterium]|nr:hypothetical protein [candidate division CSSED10-310 bacterium]